MGKNHSKRNYSVWFVMIMANFQKNKQNNEKMQKFHCRALKRQIKNKPLLAAYILTR